MKTVDFQYYSPPFREFNKAQASVIPRIADDSNLVIAFATAVGKTVLAECAFCYSRHLNPDGRVLYICPFKSLAVEKVYEWRENYQLGDKGVAINTSDDHGSVDDHLDKWLSVMTVEAFDSKTRSLGWRKFFERVDCLVVDEAHLLGIKGRGAALEAGLMRFTSFNKTSRLILLSATIEKPNELASWVKSLNGKRTFVFSSDWRPTTILVEVIPVERWGIIDEVVDIVKGKLGKSILVFVQSKKLGREMVRRLKRENIRSAFHSASVSKSRRRDIEQAFSMRSLNVVVATSTLSAGVNL